MDRVKSTEPITLVLFAILSGGGFAFMKLASEMLEGESWTFDEAVLKFFRRPSDPSIPIGPGWLTHVMRGTTKSPATVSALSWLFLILSGFATGASWMCHFRALKIGDAARVAPIDKLSVVFVAVFAVLFLGASGSRGPIGSASC